MVNEVDMDVESIVDATTPSKYLGYLPAIYSEDDFMGRFLKIFEDTLTPIENTIDHLDLYFDSQMAPEGFLPWLASWVDLALDEEWPLEKQRELIGSAVELYQWRGTRRGLREYLRIYTGVEPIIVEHFGGIRLGEHSKLGWNTILGDGLDHSFTVTIEVDDPSAIDVEKVKSIIEEEKPAHVGYFLEITKPKDLLGCLLDDEQ